MQWIVEPATVPVMPPGSIALGRIPSISEVVIAFTALTSGIGCYVFSDKVLRGNQQQSTMVFAGNQQQSTMGLDITGTTYIPVLRDVLSNFQACKCRKSSGR